MNIVPTIMSSVVPNLATIRSGTPQQGYNMQQLPPDSILRNFNQNLKHIFSNLAQFSCVYVEINSNGSNQI